MGLLFIGWDLRPTYRPFDIFGQHGRGQRFLVTDAEEDQRLALQDFWDFREGLRECYETTKSKDKSSWYFNVFYRDIMLG